MEIILQPSPRHILDYFSNLSVNGVELAPALSTSLVIWRYHGYPKNKPVASNLYPVISSIYPIFNWNLRRKLGSGLIDDLPQVDILCLLTGAERVAQITKPILAVLSAFNRFVLFSHHVLMLNLDSVASFPFEYLMVPPAYASALKQVWPELVDRVKSASRRFDLTHETSYHILAILGKAVMNIYKAEAILEQMRPKMILTEHDHRPVEAIFCQVARQRGIPSVTLVHGIQGGDMLSDTQWAPLLADQIIVWGKWMFEFFISMGISEKQIKIGGYPRIRPLTDQDLEEAQQLLPAKYLNSGKPSVLFISSSLRNEKPAVELFVETAKSTTNYQFLIRPHPSEDTNWYQENLPENTVIIQDPKIWNLYQSLALADVVVGSGSAACVDALLVAKHLILVPEPGHDYRNLPILSDALIRGAAKFANNSLELKDMLFELFNEKNKESNLQAVQEFAANCVDLLGEDAAKSCANIISEIICENV